MKFILLSGGSGKRLWPLSNDARSKQFLKVLPTKDGALESMVQRVKRQITKHVSDRDIYIATSKSQVEILKSQLGNDIHIIIEPTRRDTFPAIALAVSYLYSVQNIPLDETIVTLPVDPFVDDEFFSVVRNLENALDLSNAELALIGIRPTYPSEKYGYIVPSKSTDNFLAVDYFTEKPTEEKAIELMKQNALWNSGVFSFKLATLINKIEQKGLPTDYEQLIKVYFDLDKISFDYAVVEETKNIVCIPYGGNWKDLGTWNTLTEEITSPMIGKGIIAEEAINTHVINELDIPVTVLGVKDSVIALSPDGVLVTTKEKSPQIKQYVEDHQPMYEERRWGSSTILDYTKTEEGLEVYTRKIIINSECNLSYQRHHKSRKTWTIISGLGEFLLNGSLTKVTSGDVLHINEGELHSIKAITQIQIIEVQSGLGPIDEEIDRLAVDWQQITEKYITQN
ncbi:sugar phosphate nucleotidyltransferase [Caldifermentibacillus hisashii]|uniref:sugar phosphate nucleotidyltransferase n=1 Tax=Caldifermentibacillus hisashii TaxID=996558 RepID=UPI002E0929E3|nr:sugar phosphate nucleotidyltransferase [Caldifermentibacillus hisashii]MEC5271318.1 sugar phosphate nucleotidyltransferase [Caldifermentibacillus hisashii]